MPSILWHSRLNGQQDGTQGNTGNFESKDIELCLVFTIIAEWPWASHSSHPNLICKVAVVKLK